MACDISFALLIVWSARILGSVLSVQFTVQVCSLACAPGVTPGVLSGCSLDTLGLMPRCSFAVCCEHTCPRPFAQVAWPGCTLVLFKGPTSSFLRASVFLCFCTHGCLQVLGVVDMFS